MVRGVVNRILGKASIDEKVTKLSADDGDVGEEEETSGGDEQPSDEDESVAGEATSTSSRTPSMSEAASSDELDGIGERELDDVDISDEEITDSEMNISGIDPEKIEELEQQPSSLENKSAANFLIPTTNPVGRGQMEIGFAKISGTGEVEIPYESSFTGQPALVTTNFGFFEFDIPTWFGWSYDLDINFYRQNFDFDFNLNINWTTIRLPSFAFLWSVEESNFKMFNAWGETWVTYVAVNR